MAVSRVVALLTLMLSLAACGKDEEAEQESEQVVAASQEVRSGEPHSDECGKGGAQCPAGLECVSWQDGRTGCGPAAIDAAVLITDTTLGGRCVFDEPADTLPGASIASVLLIGTDGLAKGYGRMLWDAPGFEVAAERGSPPDGAAPAGDACSSAYHLGCDGQAVFEIVADNGDVQKIREGDALVVHLGGQDSCESELADEIEAAICSDRDAAASGDLASCASKVRMVEARSDTYGSHRFGGTIRYIAGQ